MTTLQPAQAKPALKLVSSERLRKDAVRPTAGAREPLGGAARRLLEALAGDRAYGFLDGAVVTVTGMRRGASLKVASAPAEVAQMLVDRNLATWAEPARSGRQRLVISAAGHAWRARVQAPDSVDPFLAQHRPVAPSSEKGEPAVDCGESPLTWLATRKGRDGRPLIDSTQLEAGERLRRDLTVAAMVPRVTANWGAPAGKSGGGAQPFPEVVLAARQRATRALDTVGPAFNGLLMDVCGFLKGLETIEAERGWPARSGKVVLVLALNQLARHYGLAAAAVGPARSRGVGHWGTEDYRPSITPASDEI